MHGSDLLQTALDELAHDRGPGVFALVADAGDVVFTGSVGTADLERPRVITAEDRFRIASVTKTYLATVVLQLVAEQQLHLYDGLAALLPGLVPESGAITVELLLRMRSGLPDYVRDVLGDPPEVARLQRYFAPQELISRALSQPDRWAPGKGWRYSNTDYVLLGLIVERVTQQPLGEIFHERIFRSLGLSSTYLPGRELHIEGRHSRGYLRQDLTSGYVDATEFTPSECWAAGAIISTPPEVARFLDALLSGRLLPAHLLAAMRRTQSADADLGYGMGLARYTLRNGTVVYGHGGTHFGVDCYAFRSDHGRTVIIYQNSWDRVTRGIPRQNPFLDAAFAASGLDRPVTVKSTPPLAP
ncbi:serine hydrolase domain-containing protein [Streptacidiphilus monticola]|uniref:Serine hydrolase domain-containing protein n=1 Tax=Streptacidiphilus monticola TaxID=2161674 RepID=A0ABW1G1T6_9ACTN